LLCSLSSSVSPKVISVTIRPLILILAQRVNQIGAETDAFAKCIVEGGRKALAFAIAATY